MLQRVLKGSKRLYLTLAVALMMTLPALASESGGGSGGSAATADVSVVTDAIVNGLTAAVPKILIGIGALAAVGITIFAARFAVRAGLSMFRQVTGR